MVDGMKVPTARPRTICKASSNDGSREAKCRSTKKADGEPPSAGGLDARAQTVAALILRARYVLFVNWDTYRPALAPLFYSAQSNGNSDKIRGVEMHRDSSREA